MLKQKDVKDTKVELKKAPDQKAQKKRETKKVLEKKQSESEIRLDQQALGNSLDSIVSVSSEAQPVNESSDVLIIESSKPTKTDTIPSPSQPRKRPVNSEYEQLPLNKRKRRYMNDMGYSKPKRRRKKKKNGSVGSGGVGSISSCSAPPSEVMTEEDNNVSADEEEMNDDDMEEGDDQSM